LTPNDKKKSGKMNDGDGLFIPNRQLSLLMSGALMLAFFVFIGGYFLGKNTIVEPFVARVEQTAFADQIYSSLCARYDQDSGKSCEEMLQTMHMIQDNIVAEQNMPTEVPETTIVAEHSKDNPISQPVQIASNRCYAPLIGYGKEQSALAFSQKLVQRGIPVTIKKYPSKTAKGKVQRYWYQVVTEPYDDRDALQVVVNKIAQEEKIKDIKIIDIA
jgi:hypothetical protein